MSSRRIRLGLRALSAAAMAVQLGGCTEASNLASDAATSERECLARVMYFESLRSSEDGMLAVGTVVMNRLESGLYARSICGVVGQKNQFAPGTLSQPMRGPGAALARQVAANVLGGQRHPKLAKNVMFFHTAGYHFPYTNMRYVLAAGGNVFYYKDGGRIMSIASATPDLAPSARFLAYAPEATAASESTSASEATPAAPPSAEARPAAAVDGEAPRTQTPDGAADTATSGASSAEPELQGVEEQAAAAAPSPVDQARPERVGERPRGY